MTDENKPQRPTQLSHLPSELYATLSALKAAHIEEPEPEPVEGWNEQINKLFILAAKATSKNPLTRSTVATAILNLEIALAAAFDEHGDDLDPVAFQAWEAAGAALGKAGKIAGPV
jgi:hypothetical protein